MPVTVHQPLTDEVSIPLVSARDGAKLHVGGTLLERGSDEVANDV